MNPFDEFELDPRLGVRELTDQLRERIEDASSEPERQRLREAWEALTKHPRGRVHAAWAAVPQPAPPRLAQRRAAAAPPIDLSVHLGDLVVGALRPAPWPTRTEDILQDPILQALYRASVEPQP